MEVSPPAVAAVVAAAFLSWVACRLCCRNSNRRLKFTFLNLQQVRDQTKRNYMLSKVAPFECLSGLPTTASSVIYCLNGAFRFCSSDSSLLHGHEPPLQYPPPPTGSSLSGSAARLPAWALSGTAPPFNSTGKRA